jgi:hypothetical protein
MSKKVDQSGPSPYNDRNYSPEGLITMLDFILDFFSLLLEDSAFAYLKNPTKSRVLRLLIVSPLFLLAGIMALTTGLSLVKSPWMALLSAAVTALFLVPAVHFTRIILFKHPAKTS